MKHLKSYEGFSEKEMDELLDKMLDKKPLSKEEEHKLKNIGNADWEKSQSYRSELIKDIKSKMDIYGTLTMYDLQADSSPVHKSIDQEIHLVERLDENDVTVVVYGGYGYETELDDYQVKYEDLETDTLESINDLLKDAANSDLIGGYEEDDEEDDDENNEDE